MPPAADLDLLDSLTRDELITRARELGAKRPEVMTRVELRDEVVRLSETDAIAQKKQRGWLGVARDLVASVVESGLNMPDTAAKIRGERGDEHVGPPPVATVTLAEIYIAQGHPERALRIVEEVLAREPDHTAALALRERLQINGGAERRRPRVPEAEPDTKPPEPAQATAPSAGETSTADETSEGDQEDRDDEDSAPRPSVVARAHVHQVDELAPGVELVAPTPRVEVTAAPAPEPAVARSARPEPACVLVREGAEWTARWQGGDADGLVLRVAAFMAGKAGPERVTRDVNLGAVQGTTSVRDVPAGAIVRAALGSLDGQNFRPLTVAVVVDSAAGRQAVYRPPGYAVSALERAAIS